MAKDAFVLPAMDGTRRSLSGNSEKSSTSSKREASPGKLSDRSINAVLTLVGTILNSAVDDGYLQFNPAQRLKKLPHRKREVPALSPQQVSDFLQLVQEQDPKLHIMVFVAVTCGLRRGELLALKWGDVDFASNRIAIRRSWVHGQFQGLKTERSNRSVNLLSSTAAILRSHQKSMATINPDNLIFDRGVEKMTGKPIDPTNFSNTVSQLMRDAGLPARTTLHSLRHTFASMLLEDEVPVERVSRMLGHSTSTTTMNIYSHELPGIEERIRAKHQKAFAGTFDTEVSSNEVGTKWAQILDFKTGKKKPLP
ncbi:MAG: site-specific integrase [Chloroflexi bacterium]|nr:site-specific integrase [Chloroflexota bacterium]